ncbi:Hypothetical_protein [Hexamita inflata]|uniref:Hypothetical_protein n=1 Tax=Hexamita inflata TaxID=28002 RepID=A0AA86RG17_9EUKA|nr:Hypothetical protein HINF_LOCUS63447 [Hexamita inflata]
MEVQGEKDTFDKSYQPNDSQNLTQTVIHGADSLCSTRNLCRSSVEDFDADSGKISSIICQNSFLNKAGYFPNGHHPVEQVRNTLQTPQSCQQEKLQLQTEQQQQESSEQCKKTVNIIYNNSITLQRQHSTKYNNVIIQYNNVKIITSGLSTLGQLNTLRQLNTLINQNVAINLNTLINLNIVINLNTPANLSMKSHIRFNNIVRTIRLGVSTLELKRHC